MIENAIQPKLVSKPPEAEGYSLKHYRLSDHAFDIIMIMFTPLLWLTYQFIAGFREWVDFNLIHIFEHIDLMVLLIGLIIVPFCLYWFILIIRIVRFFWRSFEAYKIRVYFRIFRINFSLFGIVAMTIASISWMPFLSWNAMLAGIGALVVINLFFITYEPVWKEEARPEAMDETNFTVLQPILLFVTLVVMILYWGNTPLTPLLTAWWAFVSQDIFFIIVFWTTITFTMLWFVISFFSICIYSLIHRKKDSMGYWIKVLLIIVYIYFFAKLVVLNLPFLIPEEYVSLTSMGISLSGTVVSRKSKSIVDFIRKRKEVK